MIRKHFLLCGAFIFLMCNAFGQKLEYDIIWLGKIGKLTIDIQEEKDSLWIYTNSEVKIPFYRLNWITETTSVDGKLQHSKYSQLLNNKCRESTNTRYMSKNNWEVDQDGNNKIIAMDSCFYISMLYYKEPINETQIFSERFGTLLQLVDHGDGHYRLMLPDDNYCDYFYEDGICKRIKAINGKKTIRMELTDNS